MARLLTICLTLLLAGCSSLDTSSLLGRSKFVEAGPTNPVVDVVCLWEPAEGRGLDNLPARGFAGQLLFLTRGTAEPAKVEGEIRVYVFDDQGPIEEQSKPIHQYDFKGEAFSQYLCETNMGAAYQLFIPYPRKGAHEANCALRVRYIPAGGGSPVYSKMADLTLPGAKPNETASRWQPERRRSHSADGNLTGELPGPTSKPTRKSAASIPMAADPRKVHATSTRARLQQVAAQLADVTESDAVQPAVFETDEPSSRRFRLHE